jgi:AraC family ethanolamine operon transcriptional activator
MSFPVGLCIQCRIDNADEWRERALYWGMEMFQIGKGRFQSDLKVVHTENLQLSTGWRSTGIMVRGRVPRGCVTMSTVLQHEAPVHFRGGVMAPGEIAALHHSEEVEMSTTRGARLLTVSVDAALLEQRMRTVLGLPLQQLRIHERLQLARPDRSAPLNRALVRYLDLGISSGVTARADGARWLENRILETLISSVGFPQIQAPRPQRLHLAKVAEDYLQAHADLPISVSELCEITGINQRTLFLGFQERYGLGPMAYLKVLRLNHAHRELSQADPAFGNVSVTRLAMKWGFFHLGRFSVEYRDLFGESPGETLKRPPRQMGGKGATVHGVARWSGTSRSR